MSAQHTPGPWVANDLSQRVHTQDDVTIARCEPHSTAMAKANARLIAAAPELLEALQGAMESLAMCQPRTDHGAACQHVAMLAGRAALAKARGGA